MLRAHQRLRERCPYGLGNANYRAASIDRLRRVIIPNSARPIDCNEVPDDAPAIMFSHGAGNQSPFVPELRGTRVGDPPQRRR
jgi:hypothetical protein